MSPQRLLDIARFWFGRAKVAAACGDRVSITVAALAHGMCMAAYCREVLSEACDADPITPKPKPYRVRR